MITNEDREKQSQVQSEKQNKNRKKYVAPKMEVELFEVEDIIRSSGALADGYMNDRDWDFPSFFDPWAEDK